MQIWHIPHAIFESTSQGSFNFLSIFSAIKYNSSVLFLAQTLSNVMKGAN